MWSHGRLSYIRVNVIDDIDGSLPFTTSKGCLNHTTRHRVRDGAGSPPSHICHIRNPTICPRSYAPLPAISESLTSFNSHSRTLLYTVKVGYPPKALTAVIPELPLSSLGLAPGDQLIVVQKSGSAATAPTLPSSSPVNPAYPGHQTPAAVHPSSNSNPRRAVAAPALPTDDGPDYVTMDGGYLIHRVRATHRQLHCVRGMSS
jgi:hypothetical protein